MEKRHGTHSGFSLLHKNDPTVTVSYRSKQDITLCHYYDHLFGTHYTSISTIMFYYSGQYIHPTAGLPMGPGRNLRVLQVPARRGHGRHGLPQQLALLPMDQSAAVYD